jgi:hypothetical protein
MLTFGQRSAMATRGLAGVGEESPVLGKKPSGVGEEDGADV